MKDLIAIVALLLTPLAVGATTTDPVEVYPPSMCEELSRQLNIAVELGIINEQEAADINLRCWQNFS